MINDQVNHAIIVWNVYSGILALSGKKSFESGEWKRSGARGVVRDPGRMRTSSPGSVSASSHGVIWTRQPMPRL